MPIQNFEAILIERSSTHGDFAENARISQCLKSYLHLRDGWDRLTPVQRESLDMICLKISRIMSGQGEFADHWDDIAGYAQLAAVRRE